MMDNTQIDGRFGDPVKKSTKSKPADTINPNFSLAVLGIPKTAGYPHYGPFQEGLSTLGANPGCTFTCDSSGGVISSSPNGHLIFGCS
jgi:hypothetical protein